MTRAELEALIATFCAQTPMMDIWGRYPNVSADEDQATDRWACGQASRELARALRAHGVGVELICADEAEHPWVLEHLWVRVADVDGFEVDVDLTARQFYDLEHPPLAEHQNLPCPLLWTADGRHPVAGAFGRVRSVAL